MVFGISRDFARKRTFDKVNCPKGASPLQRVLLALATGDQSENLIWIISLVSLVSKGFLSLSELFQVSGGRAT